MALTNEIQEVTDQAAPLGTPSYARHLLAVRNPTGSGGTVFVGAEDVTPATAIFEIAAGDPTLLIRNGDRDSLAGLAWHVVCATAGTAEIVVGQG